MPAHPAQWESWVKRNAFLNMVRLLSGPDRHLDSQVAPVIAMLCFPELYWKYIILFVTMRISLGSP